MTTNDKPFRNCIARYEDISGVPHCTHPRSGYTKKPITPSICDKCQCVVGDSMVLPLPSLATRIKSAGNAAKDALLSPTPTPTDELARRQSICNGCKYMDGRVCRACGCNLPAKQRLLAWVCSLGFWDQSPDVGTSGSSPPIVPGPASKQGGGL